MAIYPELVLNYSALFLYGAALVYMGLLFYRGIQPIRLPLVSLCLVGAALHLLGSMNLILDQATLNLSIYQSGSLVLSITGLILAVSSFSKPVHSLFMILLPFSILSILFSLNEPAGAGKVQAYSNGLAGHVLLSVSAYGVFVLATANACLLSWENRQLKQHHLNGRTRTLPPIETLETLLFEFIWAGELLLTAAIFTGFLVFDNLFEQHLIHKTVFGLIAWVIYAILLSGRHILGWRGNTAVKLTLFGFVALVLAYTGTKFVLELVLQQT